MRLLSRSPIALLVLASAVSALAATPKAVRKKTGVKAKHRASAPRAGTEATLPGTHGGPFTDVPAGHWAYAAIKQSAEAGILQGWENSFHGKKVMNRYQMAVVVSRMIDRVGVLRAGGRVITGEDITRLEALIIEFADELAVVNKKVSTLEDSVGASRREIDLIKSEVRGTGMKAGISGTAQVRGVFTAEGDNGWGSGSFLTSRTPAPSANTGILRYRGSAVSGTGTPAVPYLFDGRAFATVSNFALNFDRQFDPKVHFHAQVDINAEGSRDSSGGQVNAVGYVPVQPAGVLAGATPSAGRGENFSFGGDDLMLNEAYVTWADWYRDGVVARMGIFALPMNFEVNGPSRTYQWTITPSTTNAKWESIRPVGLEIFQHNVNDWLHFHVGAFTPGDAVNGVPRSGTLLTAPTAFSAVPLGSNLAAGPSQLDPGTNPAGGAFGLGRFPTPLAAVMTDGPRGIESQMLSSSDLGFYGMIGGHPTNPGHTGFGWQAAYFDRNGDLRAGLASELGMTDWHAWQVAASYQFERFLVAAQYYDGTSRNYSTAEVTAAADARRLNTTPFISASGQDTESRAFMALVNWQFSRRGSVSARYENPEDATGVAELSSDIVTAALNWRTSDHGWLQAEFIESRAEATSENGFVNPSGICDQLTQVNYKLHW